MEWRAFLAITLSILVLVVFQIFFARHQATSPGPQNSGNATVAGSKNQLTNSVKKDIGPQNPRAFTKESPLSKHTATLTTHTHDSQGPAKEVVYETPLFKAVFTEEGGAIKAFYLKKYRESLEKDSPYINIVNSIPPLLPFATGHKTQGGQGFAPLFMTVKKDDGVVRFSGKLPNGAAITKEYRFRGDPYWIDLTIKVDEMGNAPIVPTMVLANRPVLKSTRYIFQGISLLGKDGYQEVDLKDDASSRYAGPLRWIGIGDKYFMTTLIPLSNTVSSWDVEMRKLDGEGLVASFISPSALGPETVNSLKFGLYLGPKDIDILKTVDHELSQAINFGWFDIVAKPLLYFLKFIYRFTHNYGVAIILLTVLIKIAFWPLAHKSAKAMKTMQKIQPKLQKLKEKYGDDKERLNKELLQIYKTYKVNPMSGCLPMLLQIPVFFALYKVLLQAIELRHAPFMLWINDLSAPDRLMIPGVDIPWVHGLPVLTILMGVSMWWQQKLTPASLDPTQAKMMQFLPVVFTFMFLTFPSGLVLYWLVNNVLSIAQQHYINKFTD